MKRRCPTQTHTDVVPYDCSCSYGPPSCSTCQFQYECRDCGKLLIKVSERVTRIHTRLAGD